MQAIFDSTLLSADMSPWVANLLILFIKGVLVLTATWVIVYTLRTSAAAIRFTVWSAGLLSLMLLPLLSSVLPAWQMEILPKTASYDVTPVPPPDNAVAPTPAEEFVGSSVAPLPAMDETMSATGTAVYTSSNSVFSFFSDLDYHWTTWAFMIWMLGVFIASIRLLLAHAGAMLLVRKSELVHDEDWHFLAERITRRLEIDGLVRLRTSSWTSVPMSVGVWRPVVVLPANADEWDESQRRTVLYHELAHVKRRDCLLHLLTQITCALYWFNPMVWFASWQLRIERERACDDLVITSGIEASSYAETLLQTARQIKKAEWSTLATVSMARQSQLEGRLLSILDPMRRRSLNKASLIVSVFMMACIVVPLAIMQPANAQEAPLEAPRPPVADVIVLPPPSAPHITIPEMVIEIPPINIPPVKIPAIEIRPIEIPDLEQHSFGWNHEGEHLGEDTPVDSLTIDQIIRLRKYGVDADFIQSIKALGFKNLTYSQLISLGKYGADAAYIRDMQSSGYNTLTLEDYAKMSKYGVNRDFVAAMQQAGYSDLSGDDLVAMSKYGVDQQMVETLKAYGYEDISVDELIAASKYGVSNELIETLDDAGIKNLRVSELVSMSKYGVNRRLIEVLASHGYSDLSADNLVSASKYGVSNELITSLSDAGYNNFSINELVSASKYGVSGRLIASLRKYGYTEVSPDALVAASKYGVSERLMESLGNHGYNNIPLEDVVSMSKYGVDSRFLSEMSEVDLELDAEDLIRMRKYGVDGPYVKRMMELGLEELSVEQLINMRKHGIDADYIRSMRDNK